MKKIVALFFVFFSGYTRADSKEDPLDTSHPHIRFRSPMPGVLQDTAAPFDAVGNSLMYTATVNPAKQILVAGQYNNQWQVVRYNPDGSRDTTFGGGGNGVISDTGVGSGVSRARCITLDYIGRILVLGDTTDSATGNPVMAVVRYTSSGIVEQAVFETGLSNAVGLGIVTSGRIGFNNFFVSGYLANTNVNVPFVISYLNNMARATTRLPPDGIVFGTPGARFNTQIVDNGVLNFAVGTAVVNSYLIFPPIGALQDNAAPFDTGEEALIYGSLIDAQGNLLVCGNYNSIFTVVRYTSVGSRDTTFGTNGVVQITGQSPSNAYSIIEDTNGNYYVAGEATVSGTTVITIAKYDQNGSLITTFANGGIVQHSVSAGESRAYNLALAEVFPGLSESLLVVGQVTDTTDLVAASLLYDLNGQPETSFGVNGVQTYTDFGSGFLKTLITNPFFAFAAAGQMGDRAALLKNNGSQAFAAVLSGL